MKTANAHFMLKANARQRLMRRIDCKIYAVAYGLEMGDITLLYCDDDRPPRAKPTHSFTVKFKR